LLATENRKEICHFVIVALFNNDGEQQQQQQCRLFFLAQTYSCVVVFDSSPEKVLLGTASVNSVSSDKHF